MLAGITTDQPMPVITDKRFALSRLVECGAEVKMWLLRNRVNPELILKVILGKQFSKKC